MLAMEVLNSLLGAGDVIDWFPSIVFRAIAFPSYLILKFATEHAAVQYLFKLVL